MIFHKINILSQDRTAIETEVRFAIASAKVDGCELAAICVKEKDGEKDVRTLSAVNRTLAALMREGRVTFYISCSAMDESSTEAEFLKNKYSDFLEEKYPEQSVIYVKM